MAKTTVALCLMLSALQIVGLQATFQNTAENVDENSESRGMLSTLFMKFMGQKRFFKKKQVQDEQC